MTIVRAMSAAIKLNECYDEPSGEKLSSRARAENSNSYGGNVDEILKRLDKVESTVTETREQVIDIAATIPHLATKTDIRDARVEISELRTEVRSIAATIPHMTTKADLNAEMGSLRAEVRSGFASQKAEMKVSELATIKWIIAIVLSSAGLAATIARFAR
jgi:hypothetical protein